MEAGTEAAAVRPRLEVSASLRLVVPGNPPRKDDWLRPGKTKSGKPSFFLKTAAKDFCSRLGFEWLKARRPKIIYGEWTLHLHIYVKLRKAIGDESFPFRDCDSSVSCVLDALQREGAIDDDLRIGSILLNRSHDPKDPRTDITLFGPPPAGDD